MFHISPLRYQYSQGDEKFILSDYLMFPDQLQTVGSWLPLLCPQSFLINRYSKSVTLLRSKRCGLGLDIRAGLFRWKLYEQ